jgi:hypothetical protein
MKVNLNNNIKVKLTEAAKTYLANRHVKLFGEYPRFTLPKEDKEGYSEWQLWNFIGHFGEAMQFPVLTYYVEENSIEIVN